MTADPHRAEDVDTRRPDLASLTGLRSGKRSYYREYRESDERLARAVRAMDSISRALVRTVEGPRGLLEEVARTASAHLSAQWTLLSLADGQLPGARPRFVVVDSERRVVEDEELPAGVRRELGSLRAGHQAPVIDTRGWVRVPMNLEGATVGGIALLHGLPSDPEPGDLSVLRILANQAAVSLHTSEQFQAGTALHRRAQRLHDETAAQARDLAERTAALRRAQDRLVVADQWLIVDEERHRIARELHDTVAQQVLTVGMTVDLAERDAAQWQEQHGASTAPIRQQLRVARDLSRDVVDQLRQAIYALSQHRDDTVRSLPELLSELVRQHDGKVSVRLRVHGTEIALPESVRHELTRAVGEALFNVKVHSGATRAVVRVNYRPDLVIVSVADDGHGDPAQLRRVLRVTMAATGDGRHRGLANLHARITSTGGDLRFRRSRMGGVEVQMRLPLPLPDALDPGLIGHLLDPPPVTDQATPTMLVTGTVRALSHRVRSRS
ncbi:MadS family sensor histidine kinase [Allobranchiibius huperziae]|uniref:Signal transduction histidine kinase n=1 Tax=Allobranchiibius huperziae TaxID=1874116 RepID=A0A853DMP3_9MICO|nr:signal transduction histidine kinase [Allobranchiibius huperziae]